MLNKIFSLSCYNSENLQLKKELGELKKYGGTSYSNVHGSL